MVKITLRNNRTGTLSDYTDFSFPFFVQLHQLIDVVYSLYCFSIQMDIGGGYRFARLCGLPL
jgi:hypothetical protein